MSQKERENFYRNSTVIVDHGREVLSLLLENELSNRNISLEDFINLYQHDIYHLCYNRNLCCLCTIGQLPSTVPNSRVLYQSQLDILFDKSGPKLPGHNPRSWSHVCCSPAKTNVSLNQLDITLTRCLLVNFANNCSPGTNERLSVDKLVEFRNRLYGHAEAALINDQDYTIYKAQIKQYIITIAKFCNAEDSFKQKLKDAETRPLDVSLCSQYQNILLDDIRKNEDLKQEMTILTREWKESSENLKSQIENLNSNFQDVETNSKAISEQIKGLQISSKEASEMIYNRFEDSKSDLFEKVRSVGLELHDDLQKYTSESENKIADIVKKENQNFKSEVIAHHKQIQQQIQSLEECIRKEELFRVRDQRLRNLIDQCLSRIQSHKNDETFVETYQLENGKTILDTHHILVLQDIGGTGKTTLSLHLASIYQKNGYIPLFLSNRDVVRYRDLVPLTERCFVVIEDLFGKSNAEYDEDTHRNILDFLASFLETSSTIRIVFNIRMGDECDDDILSKHQIFKGDYDINMRLSDKEKMKILLSHMNKNSLSKCETPINLELCFEYDYFSGCSKCNNEIMEIPGGHLQICVDMIYMACMCDTYIGFPECCRMFCSEKDFTLMGSEYFRNTTKPLFSIMNTFFGDGFENIKSRYKFCLLADTLVRKPLMDQVLRSLLDKYLMETSDCYYDLRSPRDIGYMVKHETIAEAVLMSLGNPHPKIVLNLEICDIDFISSHIRPQIKYVVDGSRYMVVPSDILITKLISILKEEKKTLLLFKKLNTGEAKIVRVRSSWDTVTLNSDDESEDDKQDSKQKQNKKDDIKPQVKQKSVDHQSCDTHTEEETRIIGSLEEGEDDDFTDYKDNTYDDNTTLNRQCSSISEKVGRYLKKLMQNEKHHTFAKTFTETIPHSCLYRRQMMDFFSGITNRGTCHTILTLDLDNISDIILKYATVKVFCLLFRPMSSCQIGSKFYKMTDQAFHERALVLLNKFSTYYHIKEIGSCLYTIGVKEGNHEFVRKFCGDLIEKCKEENKIKYLIDGLCDGGKRSDAITIHRYFSIPDLFK